MLLKRFLWLSERWNHLQSWMAYNGVNWMHASGNLPKSRQKFCNKKSRQIQHLIWMHHNKRFTADIKGGLIRLSVFLETIQGLTMPEHMVKINNAGHWLVDSKWRSFYTNRVSAWMISDTKLALEAWLQFLLRRFRVPDVQTLMYQRRFI